MFSVGCEHHSQSSFFLLLPGWVLITCNLGAGPGASLVAGGDGGLVVGVCGVGGGVCGGVGGDVGLGGGDAHRSGADWR